MTKEANNRFRRELFEEDHEAVRDSFRRFLAKEVLPHYAQWERDGIIPHSVFEALGNGGYLCLPVPEAYGGQGLDDFRFSIVLTEECLAQGLTSLASGIALVNDVALPYFLEYTNEEQKQRWFPGMVSGELVTAIAMTEPSGGSDLAALRSTARLDGDAYVVNGSKTFITNGINADLVLTAVKTDSTSRHGGSAEWLGLSAGETSKSWGSILKILLNSFSMMYGCLVPTSLVRKTKGSHI
jgi:alkylation response protein AidB-like acyl-CoA dehydrogenase